ncbi:uncharacterized protein LOC144425229 [Styela clava]
MVRRIVHPEDDIIRQSQDERFANLEKCMYNIEMSNREKDDRMEAMERGHRTSMKELIKKHENDILKMQKEYRTEKKDTETKQKRYFEEMLNKNKKTQEVHMEKVQQLTAEPKKYIEDNKKLKDDLVDALKRCSAAEEKVRTLENKAKTKKWKTFEYHKTCHGGFEENEIPWKNLSRPGLKRRVPVRGNIHFAGAYTTNEGFEESEEERLKKLHEELKKKEAAMRKEREEEKKKSS